MLKDTLTEVIKIQPFAYFWEGKKQSLSQTTRDRECTEALKSFSISTSMSTLWKKTESEVLRQTSVSKTISAAQFLPKSQISNHLLFEPQRFHNSHLHSTHHFIFPLVLQQLTPVEEKISNIFNLLYDIFFSYLKGLKGCFHDFGLWMILTLLYECKSRTWTLGYLVEACKN